MKSFKKLALASAICSAPVAATAMEAIEDEALSEVTGQDGITITAQITLTDMDVAIEDDDGILTGGNAFSGGITNVAYTNAGVLLLNNLDVSTAMTVQIDSGGDAGTGAAGTNGMLNVFINTTASTVMGIDSVQVTDSNAQGTHNLAGASDVISFAAGTTVTIASGMTVDVELGNEENNFATINGNIGTVAIGAYDTATNNGDGTDDLTIRDASGVGNIYIDYMQITGITLVNTTANVTADGMVINTGHGLTNVGMTMLDVKLGEAGDADIGDIYVSGLNMSGNTITISGH